MRTQHSPDEVQQELIRLEVLRIKQSGLTYYNGQPQATNTDRGLLLTARKVPRALLEPTVSAWAHVAWPATRHSPLAAPSATSPDELRLPA